VNDAERCVMIRRCAGSSAARRPIGAKLVSHGRYVAFQMAEVAVSRMVFAEIRG